MIPNKNYSEEYALSFLPHRIAESVRKAAALYHGSINEVRLRTDCPVYITAGNKNVKCSAGCTQDEMLSVVRALCGNSLYCHSETIKEGYICTSCGLRAGVCGRAVTENGKTEKLIFSGDIGNVDRPLIRDPGTPPAADYLVIESTYGDRLHGERPDYVDQLSKILEETFARGGNVVIPSFAVGRTQELLYIIREIKERGLVKSIPNFTVYVDSPLAVETTHIYGNDMTEYYDDETLELVKKGVNPIYFDGLKVAVTSDESRMINDDKNPKVILSASGMCEAGRIRHHLKHNLWRAESTILFVGYQAVGTLGRAIVEGEKQVKLFGEPIEVKAHIEQLAGISGHADKNGLLKYAAAAAKGAKKVFVNHGNDLVTTEFAKTISETLVVEAVAPYSGSIYDLESGLCLAKGNSTYIEKPNKKSNFAASPSFERLTEASTKLQLVIGRNRGGTNKDLAKFADQILALCEKWDR